MVLMDAILDVLRSRRKQLADHIGCDVKVINRIVNARTSGSAENALKLGATFRTSAELWLNAQNAVDLARAEAKVTNLPSPILKASCVLPRWPSDRQTECQRGRRRLA
jgi:addiction module HigA family antidote